jgi:hypothetical protein
MITISIFLLCYNEEILLPHTIKHYKNLFPLSNITIYDNESTDNSVNIAKSLGCNVINFNSNNQNDVRIKCDIANKCWKNAPLGWIIMADMDEWLWIDENDLKYEDTQKTSILNIQGYDIVGESKTEDLLDVNLHLITKAIPNKSLSKKICFNSNYITDMNFSVGSHSCIPKGNIVYSSKTYINKHMSNLGLKFIIKKTLLRNERSIEMKKIGYSTHYHNNINNIEIYYNDILKRAQNITKNQQNQQIQQNITKNQQNQQNQPQCSNKFNTIKNKILLKKVGQ